MARLTKPITNSDHTRGPLDAPVQLVEYGDFQCPYCGATYPVLQKIIRQMGDRMCFAFRHFPLTEAHEYAMAAAEASEAASAQDKFWQMHDKIFSNQDELDVEHLYQFAQAMDLDMDEFDHAMVDRTFENKVHADFQSGVRSGVNGTPTLFINGVRYDGPIDLDSLLQALEEAYQIV
jgi:formate-nitrite transporter family protein